MVLTSGLLLNLYLMYKHGVKRSRNNTPASAPPPSSFTSWPLTWTQWSQNRNIQQLHFLYGLSLCFSVFLTTLSHFILYLSSFLLLCRGLAFLLCVVSTTARCLHFCPLLFTPIVLLSVSFPTFALLFVFVLLSYCLSGQTISSKPYPWHSSTHIDKELCRFL